ncbi:capsid maturation protease [Gordonia phage Blueberry]|uniref:Capsid maturation protease n=1 Tax=Gordonia phage Azula TaxID=2762397 RepID=A0A7G8LKP3_9CAUD|nr:head maturation protease [Gordonia phage Blueberry]YP_010109930.1 head maturation protease [Gordonia phage Azula]QGJ97376.1 capsid maturation protease [Gordonia phage Gambino]QZD97436.1 capsid maturation protease [Gordonia phage MissRona]ANA85466.1 capsid maturation protease [Gordonia phage Blueberry]QNJ57815.1 capsid maturation protease [Gordonia phage Azula]
MGDPVNLSALLNQPIARSIADSRREARTRAEKDGKKPTNPWYRVRNEAGSDDAEIMIYDFIDPDPWFGGISAQDFVRDLDAIDASNILVRINSPGGDVYDAIAITNALRNHDATITVQVDGLAASAASFIAMAGDEVVMCRNTEMMIHDARGFCIGNATDMAEYAEWLGRASDNIASMYAEKTGGEVKDWRKAMTAETWYTAEEAVEAGLADKVVAAKSDDDSKKAAAHFDLRVFAHAGRQQAPAPFIPAASAGLSGKEAPVATLKEGLAERLGIDADADDETALKALDEALEERSDNTQPGDGGTGEPSVGDLNKAAAKHGLRLVDSAKWDEVTAQAAAGNEARERQVAGEHARVVDSAISKGKITGARRDHFLALMKADTEGTTKLLNDLPDETAVPLSEVGHSTEPGPDSIKNVRESDAYKGLEG